MSYRNPADLCILVKSVVIPGVKDVSTEKCCVQTFWLRVCQAFKKGKFPSIPAFFLNDYARQRRQRQDRCEQELKLRLEFKSGICHASYVAAGKWLNFSEPWFLHLENRTKNNDF